MASEPKRNRGFEETHRDMIATAVRLISEKGAEALSIVALARAMGINRTTVYYHFESREALLHAVADWATEQLSRSMDPETGKSGRVGQNSRFVVENPELAKLWIDDFVSGRAIRECFAHWDEMVASMQRGFAAQKSGNGGEQVDAEVYCTMLLASTIVAPHVYRGSVRPEVSVDEAAEKFRAEIRRMLHRDGLAGEDNLAGE
jgi:AcrR family transcriptional regulator